MKSEPEIPELLDLGCGPKKRPGAWGVDHHAFDGVDQVMDLDRHPWPFDASSFSRIYAHHVIEHVADIKAFMNGIHRVGRPGALVEIVTPHFSSLDSWKDPTHRWHLAAGWHEVFTREYLTEQVQPFEHVSTEVGFSRNPRGLIGRALVRLRGLERWEKRHAFVYRGRNITTRLKVLKDE